MMRLPILARDEVKQDFMLRAEKDVAKAEKAAEAIIEDVRKRGDAAVLEYTEKFDGIKLKEIEVSADEMSAAYDSIDEPLLKAIQRAYKNIKKFHERQMPDEFRMEIEPGVEVGRRVIPLERAGLYVPGGKAVYPSVMLMLAVPAKVAGIKEIVVCTPPQYEGVLDVASLVAADICGVDKLFKVGGVQSIAAMAYGTKKIPKCDVIAGPGGPYVSAAQRLVRNDVRIDFPPGPSEGMVLADKFAEPNYVAADVLSEAEHGPDSAAVLVTDSQELALKVQKEFYLMLNELDEVRQGYVLENIRKYSGIVLCRNMEEAIAFVNDYAVEHLVVNTKDPEKTLDKLTTAGTYCLGQYSPITAGNFAAGPNAILPTGRFGRMYSGVSVDTFLKRPTVEKLSKDGLRSLKRDITMLSEFEGFPAHTKSVEVRFER
jgi:histidinol dehydrogenase